MITDKLYDYIIYSANVPGVLAANFFSEKGYSVLLLNHYGFMGGSVTEGLNCLQIVDEFRLNKKSLEIFKAIKDEKHGILYQKDNQMILNPEVVKIALQKLIEKINIDLLFHVVPFSIRKEDKYLKLSLSGKEGIFKVCGKILIDASEGYDLFKLEKANCRISELNYNMFLTRMRDNLWQSYSFLGTNIKLNDERYWISLKLPNTENDLFIENNSQIIINEFETIIQQSGGKIQLLAPQTQIIYSSEVKKISNNFFHLDSFLTTQYNFREIFTTTSELESELGKFKC